RDQGDQLSPEEREYILASADHRRQQRDAEQARAARELAQAHALANAETERAREADARRVAGAARRRAADARGGAETGRDREAEGRAVAQRRATRWALVGAAVFLCFAVVLALLAIGPVKRELTRRTLPRELGFLSIPLPPGGAFQLGCVPEGNQCPPNETPRH